MLVLTRPGTWAYADLLFSWCARWRARRCAWWVHHLQTKHKELPFHAGVCQCSQISVYLCASAYATALPSHLLSVQKDRVPRAGSEHRELQGFVSHVPVVLTWMCDLNRPVSDPRDLGTRIHHLSLSFLCIHPACSSESIQFWLVLTVTHQPKNPRRKEYW